MKATSEELAIFVAVVESGSFSRAAEQLGQANSAISRSVKKLELKLGVSLLNRTTRQLSLTEEGERYFRRVQSILQEMAAAETEIMESRNAPRGLLRIDAATPVVLHFLMPLIKPFRERYPEMTLSLVSSETFINLIERKVDVAIRAGTLTDSSLRARPLFKSQRKIIASPAYIKQFGEAKTVEDLQQHMCLQRRGLMVSFGNASGAVTGVNLGILNQKGSLYVTRPSLQGYITTREELTEASNELFSLIASGVIKVDVADAQKYALSDAQRAHEVLESRATQGSSLLIPDSPK
jgi:DNA-binding transcriptional LysR family regulator